MIVCKLSIFSLLDNLSV